MYTVRGSAPPPGETGQLVSSGRNVKKTIPVLKPTILSFKWRHRVKKKEKKRPDCNEWQQRVATTRGVPLVVKMWRQLCPCRQHPLNFSRFIGAPNLIKGSWTLPNTGQCFWRAPSFHRPPLLKISTLSCWQACRLPHKHTRPPRKRDAPSGWRHVGRLRCALKPSGLRNASSHPPLCHAEPTQERGKTRRIKQCSIGTTRKPPTAVRGARSPRRRLMSCTQTLANSSALWARQEVPVCLNFSTGERCDWLSFEGD